MKYVFYKEKGGCRRATSPLWKRGRERKPFFRKVPPPAIPLSENSLIAVGADGYHADRHAGKLFEALHIGAGGFGELIPRLARGDVFLPAGHGFVNRVHEVKRALFLRRIVHALAFVFIGHADLNGIKTGQHIQLGQGDVGEAVQPGALAQHRNILPAARDHTPHQAGRWSRRIRRRWCGAVRRWRR